jgi:branched-chain amino acid transport system permease protein
LWGPLLGVIPFVLLWELISIEFPDQTTLLLGVCFLLIVYVIPNGITGLLEDLWRGRGKLRGTAPLQRMLDASPASVRNLLQRRKGTNV